MNYTNSETPTGLVKIIMENGGEIVIKLIDTFAPQTVKNFQNLVSNNFYDGIIFHRVIKDFMIQGGDPTGTGMGGSDEKIKGEFAANGVTNNLSHERGVISMARSNFPNSASSQFFICHKDAKFLDGSYASFGQVISGIDIVDNIAECRTGANDKPLSDQKIKTMCFITEI